MRPTSCAWVLSSMVAVQRCRTPKPARKDRSDCHSASLLALTNKGSVHVWCQRGAVGDKFDRKGLPAKHEKSPGQAVSEGCLYFGTEDDPCWSLHAWAEPGGQEADSESNVNSTIPAKGAQEADSKITIRPKRNAKAKLGGQEADS